MAETRPLVVAHRGASAYRAEMTMAAFRLGVEMAADALECDVRMTADEELVCWHDSTVDRCSNGTGPVSRMTLAQLRALDCGSWFGHDGPADEATTSVVTLRELLQYLAGLPRSVGLLLETKHPSAFGGRVEEKVAADLAEFGWLAPPDPDQARVSVMSFSGAALRRMRQHSSSLPLVHLTDAPITDRLPRFVEEDKKIVLGPSVQAVRQDPDRVRRLVEAGRTVFVWTVDEECDVKLCHRAGVSAIISNRPDRAVAALLAADHENR